MIFNETRLSGAFIIELERRGDERGFFARTFCQQEFEAHGLKPVIAQAVLQSIELMADCVDSFTTRCVEGVEAKTARISELVERSLMLVTALAPAIGYEKAATIARRADDNNTTLREEAMKSGFIDAKTFDELTRPETMIGPR